MDVASDFDDVDQGDDDDDACDNDDDRYDAGPKMRNTARGGRPFPGNGKGRAMVKGGSREKVDRYGGSEPVKSSGRMSITFTRRDVGGGGKPRGRVGEHDRMRERERGRDKGDSSKIVAGREREGVKGESFMPTGRIKEKDSDIGGSRSKRRDLSSSLASPGDAEDKLTSSATSRERVDRSRDKVGTGAGKKVRKLLSCWLP